MLTAIVVVVRSSHIRSAPAQVATFTYLDRPATPTTPALHIATAAKCAVDVSEFELPHTATPGAAGRDLTPSGSGATLGTGPVVVLSLHCVSRCPEIVGVRYYVAYSTDFCNAVIFH